jgi:hypothetical protein
MALFSWLHSIDTNGSLSAAVERTEWRSIPVSYRNFALHYVQGCCIDNQPSYPVWLKRPVLDADRSTPLRAEVKIDGAIPSLPATSLWYDVLIRSGTPLAFYRYQRCLIIYLTLLVCTRVCLPLYAGMLLSRTLVVGRRARCQICLVNAEIKFKDICTYVDVRECVVYSLLMNLPLICRCEFDSSDVRTFNFVPLVSDIINSNKWFHAYRGSHIVQVCWIKFRFFWQIYVKDRLFLMATL